MIRYRYAAFEFTGFLSNRVSPGIEALGVVDVDRLTSPGEACSTLARGG
jgi:hypothetical protein